MHIMGIMRPTMKYKQEIFIADMYVHAVTTKHMKYTVETVKLWINTEHNRIILKLERYSVQGIHRIGNVQGKDRPTY